MILQSLETALSNLIGETSVTRLQNYFYPVISQGAGNTRVWNYPAIMEYMFLGLIVVLTISFVYRLILKVIEK